MFCTQWSEKEKKQHVEVRDRTAAVGCSRIGLRVGVGDGRGLEVDTHNLDC